MFEQAHVADRIQRDAAGQHQPVCAGGAQQMIHHMDHRVLEHQLRRGRLVEAILGVRPVMDVLDPQHRVGIPELIGFQGFAEDIDQRGLVGMSKGSQYQLAMARLSLTSPSSPKCRTCRSRA